MAVLTPSDGEVKPADASASGGGAKPAPKPMAEPKDDGAPSGCVKALTAQMRTRTLTRTRTRTLALSLALALTPTLALTRWR